MTAPASRPSDEPLDSYFPSPDRERWKWLNEAAKWMGEDPCARFGTQLAKIASDMIVVCDEELTIQFHNRAFLKGVGHREGTFLKHSLYEFFPQEDRKAARAAFQSLCDGYAAGLRINASVITPRGIREFDIRAVRSRCKDASYLYYLIARDDTKQIRESRAMAQALAEAREAAMQHETGGTFLKDLPLAMWRTNHRLKVESLDGGLWQDLGIHTQAILNANLSDRIAPHLPAFLSDIDFCHVMAGRSSQQQVTVQGEVFEVAIEPVLNERKRLVGTIGILRRCKVIEPIAPELLDDEANKVIENSASFESQQTEEGFLRPGAGNPKQAFPRPLRPPGFSEAGSSTVDETEPVYLSR